MPATAAMDNETLDHLLSVVDDTSQFRGDLRFVKGGGMGKERGGTGGVLLFARFSPLLRYVPIFGRFSRHVRWRLEWNGIDDPGSGCFQFRAPQCIPAPGPDGVTAGHFSDFIGNR
jgi:hypothetical protein